MDCCVLAHDAADQLICRQCRDRIIVATILLFLLRRRESVDVRDQREALVHGSMVPLPRNYLAELVHDRSTEGFGVFDVLENRFLDVGLRHRSSSNDLGMHLEPDLLGALQNFRVHSYQALELPALVPCRAAEKLEIGVPTVDPSTQSPCQGFPARPQSDLYLRNWLHRVSIGSPLLHAREVGRCLRIPLPASHLASHPRTMSERNMEFCCCGNELRESKVKLTVHPCRCKKPLSHTRRTRPDLDPLSHVSELQFNERRRLGLVMRTQAEIYACGKW